MVNEATTESKNVGVNTIAAEAEQRKTPLSQKYANLIAKTRQEVSERDEILTGLIKSSSQHQLNQLKN